MRNLKRSLDDMLPPGFAADLKAKFANAAAAAEFEPLPPGRYDARLDGGEFFTAGAGTPGYRLRFVVTDGPFAGRQVNATLWLTDAALPYSKRELAKIGINDLGDPFPPGLLCEVQVANRERDGRTYDEVRRFVVTGRETPNPFAPAETGTEGSDEAESAATGPLAEGEVE